MVIEYCVYLLISIIAYFLIRRLILEQFYISLRNKYVLITGCDSGFGRLLAVRLLEKRVNVFAACFTQQGIDSLQTQWKAHSGKKGHLYPVHLDITSDESVQNAKKYVSSILQLKKSYLWGLVNNAGIFSIFGPDDWCGSQEYLNSLNVNTMGAVRMCHAFVPLIKQSRGRIVTMGSTAGRLHGLYVAPYVTAKFAVEGYMDCLRLELKKFGVSVHILEPGAFKTELLNHDAQRARIDRIWDSLSNETKEEYGDEYRRNFETAWESGVNVVANQNIQWVVDCYIHALFSWWPRLRYCPGWDAIFMFVPLSVFPTSFQDSILSFLYAMSPGPSLTPASLSTRKNWKSKKETIGRWVSLLAQLAMIPLVFGALITKEATTGGKSSTVVPRGNHTVTAE